jgi:hypothetical protein
MTIASFCQVGVAATPNAGVVHRNVDPPFPAL